MTMKYWKYPLTKLPRRGSTILAIRGTRIVFEKYCIRDEDEKSYEQRFKLEVSAWMSVNMRAKELSMMHVLPSEECNPQKVRFEDLHTVDAANEWKLPKPHQWRTPEMLVEPTSPAEDHKEPNSAK